MPSAAERLIGVPQKQGPLNRSLVPKTSAEITFSDKYKFTPEQWLAANKDKFDPKAFAFLQQQWQQQGVDPEKFVKAYEYKDTGKGFSGWFNKTGSMLGDDYILDSQSGQWITRNRATGQGTVEGVDNLKQAEFEIGNIQNKINELNRENDRLKSGRRILGMLPPGVTEAIRGNEATINDLRKRYDAISRSLSAFKLDPLVSEYLKDAAPGGGAGIISNEAQTFDLVNRVKELINYAPGEIPENAATKEFLDAYIASLENPFKSATENVMADLSRRGMLGSGYRQEKIGEMLSSYGQAKKQQTGNLTADYFKNVAQEKEDAFNNAINEYISNLQQAYKASGQSANDYFAINSAKISKELNNLATQYQTQYQDVADQYGTNMQNFYDTMNATKSLFGEVGRAAGTYLSDLKTSSKAPLSERINAPYDYYNANANISNILKAPNDPFASPWGSWGQ